MNVSRAVKAALLFLIIALVLALVLCHRPREVETKVEYLIYQSVVGEHTQEYQDPKRWEGRVSAGSYDWLGEFGMKTVCWEVTRLTTEPGLAPIESSASNEVCKSFDFASTVRPAAALVISEPDLAPPTPTPAPTSAPTPKPTATPPAQTVADLPPVCSDSAALGKALDSCAMSKQTFAYPGNDSLVRSYQTTTSNYNSAIWRKFSDRTWAYIEVCSMPKKPGIVIDACQRDANSSQWGGMEKRTHAEVPTR